MKRIFLQDQGRVWGKFFYACWSPKHNRGKYHVRFNKFFFVTCSNGTLFIGGFLIVYFLFGFFFCSCLFALKMFVGRHRITVERTYIKPIFIRKYCSWLNFYYAYMEIGKTYLKTTSIFYEMTSISI